MRVLKCCTDPDGPTPCSDITGVVRLWSLESLRPVATQQLHDARAGVLCLQHIAPQQHDSWCSDGDGSSSSTGAGSGGVLLSSGRDGSVRAWALREGGLSERPVFAADTGAFSSPQDA
jgi:WD40 repeat protein